MVEGAEVEHLQTELEGRLRARASSRRGEQELSSKREQAQVSQEGLEARRALRK